MKESTTENIVEGEAEDMLAWSEPTAETEGIPELEEEGGSEPLANDKMVPEFGYSEFGPQPEWESALTKWGGMWPLHVYTFASLYLLIALLAAGSMMHYLKDRQRLRQGKLTFTLQCLLLQFTSLRAVVMFVNPYLTQDDSGATVLGILWSLSSPGITAAFSALLLVLLDTTKMSLGPPVFQNLLVLLAFTGCHFAIVIIAEGVCFSGKFLCKPVLLICQTLFALYGLVLSAGYGYIAIVLTKRLTAVDIVVEGSENRRVTRLIKILSLAALISLSITVTHVFAASSEFGIYNDVTHVDAWSWWTLQTFLRFEELASACLIMIIAFRKPCTCKCINLTKIINKSLIQRTNRIGVANAVTLLTPHLGAGIFKHVPKTTTCMLVVVPTITVEPMNLPNAVTAD